MLDHQQKETPVFAGICSSYEPVPEERTDDAAKDTPNEASESETAETAPLEVEKAE